VPAAAAPEAAPAPVAPAAPPAPPAEPRTVSASSVQYLRPPAPVYPRASRRQGEAGRVTLRVLIDEQGRPAELRVQSTSGYARLDEAALKALRDARFRPYAENGVAQRVWALVPIHFDLEN
jgi:protein TonB